MNEPAQTEAWSIADAKTHLSELLETVGRDGPQTISKRGRPVAVVVSFEEWEHKKMRKGSLADFFATSPLREFGGELELPSRQGTMREVEL